MVEVLEVIYTASDSIGNQFNVYLMLQPTRNLNFYELCMGPNLFTFFIELNESALEGLDDGLSSGSEGEFLVDSESYEEFDSEGDSEGDLFIFLLALYLVSCIVPCQPHTQALDQKTAQTLGAKRLYMYVPF